MRGRGEEERFLGEGVRQEGAEKIRSRRGEGSAVVAVAAFVY